MEQSGTQYKERDSLTVVDVSSVSGASKVWQEIVDNSLDGWIWHTRTAFIFNLCAGKPHEAEDHSFFICKNSKPVGVVPLIIQKKQLGEFSGREAAFYSGFLPWPCFHRDATTNLISLEDFAFEELERRTRAAKVGHIRMQLTPPVNCGNEHKRVERIINKYAYVHSHIHSHIVPITSHTLSLVRERYKRYYKKFSPLFELTISEGKDVTLEVEEMYFNLHIKDAGGQFRPRESYAKQSDTARLGEGFYVIATEKKTNTITGMLLVSVYKKSAFDNSVAIDPVHADKYIGHLLKWKAIEELLWRDIPTFELPVNPDGPTFWELPTMKQRGISHFKEGWARGNIRTVFQIDKFLEKDFLHAFVSHQEHVLRDYFHL